MLLRRPHGRGAPQGVQLPPQPVWRKGWERIICVASGPSLTAEQGFIVSCASPQWRTIAVNTSWQRVPMADVLYACDQHWWKHYHAEVAAGFRGECWTADRWAAHKYGLCFAQNYDRPGLSREIGVLHSGSNSGYQAVNLAYLFGAKKIILVGYDMQRTYGLDHWHGAHPEGLGALPLVQYGKIPATYSGHRDFPDWLERFEVLAADLHEDGVEVMNCSIETALECFAHRDLTEALRCP